MPMTNPYVRQWSDVVQGTVDSAANFAKGASSILDQKLREQAELDVKRMQLNLEDKTNQFMLELQQGKHGGIENWEQATQDFLQRAQASDDKNSPFYCKNQYTAKLYNQTFGANEVEIKNRVANQVWGLHVGEEQQKMSESLNQIANSSADPQLKIDQSADIIDQAQRVGIYTKPQAEKLKAQAYMEQHDAVVNAKYKEYYAQGMTPSEIEKKLNGEDMGLLMGGEEYASKLDKKAMIEKSCQMAQREIRQVQDENNAALTAENTEIMNGLYRGNPASYTAALSQQKKIRQMERVSINENDQRTRDFELNAAIKMYLDGKTVTGTGAKEKSDKEKNFNAVAAQIKNGQKEEIKKLLNEKDGFDGTIYSIKKAYLQPYMNRINTIKQNMRKLGIPEEQINQEYADTVGVAMGGLINNACDAGLFPTELKKDVNGVLAQIKEKQKSMAKKDAGAAAVYASEAMEFVWDTVCGSNIKNISPEAISKAYSDFEQTQNAKTYDRLVYGNKHDDGTWGESDLVKALNQQKNDALIWTDEYGNKHAPEGVEEGIWLGKTNSICIDDLTNTLSTDKMQITANDITQAWELNDEGTDFNARLNYIVGDKMYRYVTDEKGKNVRLEVKGFNQKWSEAQEVHREKIKKPGIFDKVKEAFTLTEEQKQAKAARDEARRKTFEAEQEFRKNMPEEFESLTARMVETNKVPENFAGTEEMWNNLSDNEKEGYYTQYLSGAYDSLEGYQGIDKYRARYEKFMGGNK